ncbi:maleylacetate reductase [Georgenia sp. SUBG003]|uniref:maleylacetate reductase n=1 Tax=Georgenia sp. SUBG003 TaxID=1497974 RepID=UPI0004D7B412|nr:hypothetical protein DA06_20255 [Georgenia sp. SUBG003]
MQFTFETAPARVVFGRGTVRTALAAELARLGARRIMVVTAPRNQTLAHSVATPFGDAVVSVFTEVAEHVPAPVGARAVALAREVRADTLLSIGGGSTTGTAKIVARDLHLPILAVPTTYSGSEATPVWGTTRDGRRETGSDPAVRPRTVVLDPDLTDRLPRDLAVASGLSALARAVEAHWAPGASPIGSAMADEAVHALATGLRGIGRDSLAEAQAPEKALTDPVSVWAGTPTAAGEQLLYGAYLAGATFASAGAGLHHKICQTLGGTFNLPHAALHAVVLPHVLAFNAPAVPQAAARIARALEAEEAVSGLRALAASVGAPRTLAQLGLLPRQLDEAVDRVSATLPFENPRHVGKNEVRAIITAAFGGHGG